MGISASCESRYCGDSFDAINNDPKNYIKRAPIKYVYVFTFYERALFLGFIEDLLLRTKLCIQILGHIFVLEYDIWMRLTSHEDPQTW